MANIENKQTIRWQSYSLPYNNPSDSTQFKANIDYLYEKIEQCTRNVTYFDLYKIRDVAQTATELESKINNLDAYTSLVVNAPHTLNNVKYNIGDVVIKLPTGQTQIIEAQRGGIFYPAEIKQQEDTNNTYNFIFKYASVEPTDNDKEFNIGEDPLTEPGKQISFKGIKSEGSGSPYNIVQIYSDANTETSTEITFTKAKTTETTPQDISPIVHAYFVTSDGYMEEVYVDQTIENVTQTTTDDSYKITLKAPQSFCKRVVIK